MKKQMTFKGIIVAEPDSRKDTLNFYWSYRGRQLWLFSQRYTKSVYDKFRLGLRDYDIRGYKWGGNYRMDKTIYKIPSYMAYLSKEVA